ncbi:MAG: glycosyltransferase [Gammaproteobacteria bacterium]|nr:glycosyltransferase [Gammaproteobacteria bacterium]
MRNLFYFPLESVKSRYTAQLGGEWMPDAFSKFPELTYIRVDGVETEPDLRVGVVLDAVGRGYFSLTQVANFLEMIREGQVKDNDIVFVQDFWTPGLEAIFYAIDLYGIDLKFYTMLHAQSVDEYDFTYSMKDWMRWYELGFDSRLSGIFVASTIHKEQLRAAGFKAPIQVVSLPISYGLVSAKIKCIAKQDKVVYCSRLDNEKNPFFMLAVAKRFLKAYPGWKWYITTSSAQLKSNIPDFVQLVRKKANQIEGLIIKEGLSKEEYYQELGEARFVFNSSLQDYVSWTLLEACIAGCDLVYPDFRSFPECISSPGNRYRPFDVDSALQVFSSIIDNMAYTRHNDIALLSSVGRLFEVYVMVNDITEEYNIWHQAELIGTLLLKSGV